METLFFHPDRDIHVENEEGLSRKTDGWHWKVKVDVIGPLHGKDLSVRPQH